MPTAGAQPTFSRCRARLYFCQAFSSGDPVLERHPLPSAREPWKSAVFVDPVCCLTRSNYWNIVPAIARRGVFSPGIFKSAVERKKLWAINPQSQCIRKKLKNNSRLLQAHNGNSRKLRQRLSQNRNRISSFGLGASFTPSTPFLRPVPAFSLLPEPARVGVSGFF